MKISTRRDALFAQLQRDLVGRQGAHHVDQQARRQHDGAVAYDLALERHAQPDLHVGRSELDGSALGLELNAG